MNLCLLYDQDLVPRRKPQRKFTGIPQNWLTVVDKDTPGARPNASGLHLLPTIHK